MWCDGQCRCHKAFCTRTMCEKLNSTDWMGKQWRRQRSTKTWNLLHKLWIWKCMKTFLLSIKRKSYWILVVVVRERWLSNTKRQHCAHVWTFLIYYWTLSLAHTHIVDIDVDCRLKCLHFIGNHQLGLAWLVLCSK